MSPLLPGASLFWVCVLQMQQWNKTPNASVVCWRELSCCTLTIHSLNDLSLEDPFWWFLLSLQSRWEEPKWISQCQTRQKQPKWIFPVVLTCGMNKMRRRSPLNTFCEIYSGELCRKCSMELCISPVLSTGEETTAEKELWKFSQLQSS